MSDLPKWKIHGPVRTLKTEFAEWDLNQGKWGEWGPARSGAFCTFLPDGNISEIEHNNPNGSIAHSRYQYNETGRLVQTQFWINNGPPEKSLYFYDEAQRHIQTVVVNHDGTERETEVCSYDSTGRKTKVCFLPPHDPDISQGYSIEGIEHAYVVPGATTMTVQYDKGHQPTKCFFHDADQHLISHIVFARDSDGRVLSEEMYLGEQGPFPDLQQRLEGMSAEDQDRATVLFKKLFGHGQAFMSATYEYDSDGRLIARSRLMSTLSEERSTLRYDDRGNIIEETTEDNSRDAQLGENGGFQTSTENSRKQQIRFDYKYDALGNWTERLVWIRHEPNPDFQRSNVERREISYYAG